MEDNTRNKMKITVLGARGSIPTEGKDMLEFGGATSCILVEAGDQAIFLDAGTGIISAPDIGEKQISVLITHPHLDHILGLPFFPYIIKDCKISIYSPKRDDTAISEQVEKYLSPPLWPCRISDYPSEVALFDAELPIKIGDVLVEGIPSIHPGGGTVYKLTYEGKSLVYATDYEHDEDRIGELIGFSKNTDLLFYDSQYTEEEYETHRGYGHSTAKWGIRVMKESGAKMLRFVHHDPGHTDEFLRRMEAEIKSEACSYARRGEVIVL